MSLSFNNSQKEILLEDFSLDRKKINIQIIGFVKSGKSLLANEFINFQPLKVRMKKSLNINALFPINSKPMTIRKIIYKYSKIKENDFKLTIDCFGQKMVYEQQISNESLEFISQQMNELRQHQKQMFQSIKNGPQQGKFELVENQYKKKQFLIESSHKIMKNEVLSNHYQIVDNEGCTDPCTITRKQQNQEKTKPEDEIKKIMRMLNSINDDDMVIYCVNLNKGVIDSIERFFMIQLLKRYGSRLTFSFCLNQYIVIDYNTLVNEQQVIELIFQIPQQIIQIITKAQNEEKLSPETVKYIKKLKEQLEQFQKNHDILFPKNYLYKRNYGDEDKVEKMISQYPFNVINFHGISIKQVQLEENMKQIFKRSTNFLQERLILNLKEYLKKEKSLFQGQCKRLMADVSIQLGFSQSSPERKESIQNYFYEINKKGKNAIEFISNEAIIFKKNIANIVSKVKDNNKYLVSQYKGKEPKFFISLRKTYKQQIQQKITAYCEEVATKLKDQVMEFTKKMKKIAEFFDESVKEEEEIERLIKESIVVLIIETVYQFLRKEENEFNKLMQQFSKFATFNELQIDVPQLKIVSIIMSHFIANVWILTAGTLVRVTVVQIAAYIGLTLVSTPLAIAAGIGFGVYGIYSAIVGSAKELQDKQFYANWFKFERFIEQSICKIDEFSSNFTHVDELRQSYEQKIATKLNQKYKIEEYKELMNKFNELKLKKTKESEKYLKTNFK